MDKNRPKVAVVYKSLPQYRRHFFELLRERLDQMGIEFILIYGQPSRKDALKKDTVDLNWGIKVHNIIWEVKGRELYWQPVLSYLRDVDLVIVEQASKLLVNYVLLMRNALGKQKLAFWGHGRNFQYHTASPIGEWIKRLVSSKVHWWFAYNNMSAKIVRQLGFPPEHITVVQNAIDTRQLTQVLQSITHMDLEGIRRELSLQSENVALYAGGMYPEKRISFLLEAVMKIRMQVPDFEMIFIGSGEDANLVSEFAKEYPWVHYVGPKFDAEKVPYFALSKLFLMPGLVGLAILDTFALEVPLVTTRVPYHSPEIEYLDNGVNGVMIDNDDNPEIYAQVVVDLLRNEAWRQRLVEGCRASRNRYTVEEMVERFAIGVKQALEV